MLVTKNNIKDVIKELPTLLRDLPLQEFIQLLIYKFDEEAVLKEWQPIQFQNTLERIWEQNAKSCVLAPREHLKTSTVLYYLLKKIYTREHPLEIDYFHLSGSLAEEKFHMLLRIIENNPFLRINIKPEKAKVWSGKGIELFDGTTITPLSYQQGVRGKHPHIIVLDDVIDSVVMYSETRNRKSIEKFYGDIYPMISKEDTDKKIIIIGTVQRKDDLYHSLPADFVTKTYQAIVSKETKEVLCPELFTFEALEKLRHNISSLFGEKFWQKEYMNMPFEAMGLIIKPEWIQEYYQMPQDLMIFQGWDLAVGKDLEKGDWTVGITIGIEYGEKAKIYVLDIFRQRIDFAKRLEAIQEQYTKWRPISIGIEEVAFQYDTVQLLQQKTLLPIQGVKQLSNKVQSFQTELAPYFGNGQVFLKPEMADFRTELLSLPVGQYDDQADALKIAIKTGILQPPKTTLFGFGGTITAGLYGKRF